MVAEAKVASLKAEYVLFSATTSSYSRVSTDEISFPIIARHGRLVLRTKKLRDDTIADVIAQTEVRPSLTPRLLHSAALTYLHSSSSLSVHRQVQGARWRGSRGSQAIRRGQLDPPPPPILSSFLTRHLPTLYLFRLCSTPSSYPIPARLLFLSSWALLRSFSLDLLMRTSVNLLLSSHPLSLVSYFRSGSLV